MSEIYPETPGKPDLGQVAYEAYALASDGVSLVSGQPLPGWDDQDENIRMAWRMSAGAVLITIDQHAEPKPAKVIVVRDEVGREHRYAAPNFGMLHDGTLVIGDKRDDGELRVDAMRAPGRWTSAHKDDVLAPDSTATALGIATRALDQIANSVLEADDPRREVVRIARDAVEELDL